jgi:hypothetical protein
MAVLFNSSESAWNSLNYAIHLAHTHGWDIQLHEILDLDEYDEALNPLRLGRLIDVEHRKCNKRLKSLREMIHLKGIRITVAEPLITSALDFDGLQMEGQHVMPDLLVVGQGSLSKSLLRSVVKVAHCPVMIVPAACEPSDSSSIALYAGDRRLAEHVLEPLLDFASRTKQQISMLSVVNRKRFGLRKFEGYLPASTRTTPVSYYQVEGKDVITSVDSFIKENSIDMAAVVFFNHWWQRIFSRWTDLDLAGAVDVPVLVFKLKYPKAS